MKSFFLLLSAAFASAAVHFPRDSHLCQPDFQDLPVRWAVSQGIGLTRGAEAGSELVVDRSKTPWSIDKEGKHYVINPYENDDVALSSKHGDKALALDVDRSGSSDQRWIIECRRCHDAKRPKAIYVGEGCRIRTTHGHKCITAGDVFSKPRTFSLKPCSEDEKDRAQRFSFEAARIKLGHKKQNHEVAVGPDGKLLYRDKNGDAKIYANAGDTVTFIFNPKNHTVTQSSFKHPCQGIDGGFKSGFRPVKPGAALTEKFVVKVKNAKQPIWGYCGQVGHCQQGMVFAINPPEGKAFDKFVENAKRDTPKPTKGKAKRPDDDDDDDDDDDNDDWENEWADKKRPAQKQKEENHGKKPEEAQKQKQGNQGKKPEEAQKHKGWEDDDDDDGDDDDDDDDDDWKYKKQRSRVHKVQVGPNGILGYDKANIPANVGDKVVFIFNPKNHTVTQSSFDDPCKAIGGGFKSGFKPVAANAHWKPEFVVHVKDRKPIWGYCGQVNHCQSGMVFAINAPTHGPHTFDKFVQNAKNPKKQKQKQNDAGKEMDGKKKHGKDWKVTVGANGQLAYNEANIHAEIGDTVTFIFNPKNHTVTQSSFDDPCKKRKDGFASGFRPVSPGQVKEEAFTIKIKNDEPIYGYCGQVNHCGAGMVFAINAPPKGPQSFAAFQILARHKGKMAAGQSANKGPDQAGNKLAGAIEDDDDEKIHLEKDLIRNSYILMGLLGGAILGIIILTVIVLGRGGLKGKPQPKYSQVIFDESRAEAHSFTHTPGQKYSD